MQIGPRVATADIHYTNKHCNEARPLTTSQAAIRGTHAAITCPRPKAHQLHSGRHSDSYTHMPVQGAPKVQSYTTSGPWDHKLFLSHLPSDIHTPH